MSGCDVLPELHQCQCRDVMSCQSYINVNVGMWCSARVTSTSMPVMWCSARVTSMSMSGCDVLPELYQCQDVMWWSCHRFRTLLPNPSANPNLHHSLYSKAKDKLLWGLLWHKVTIQLKDICCHFVTGLTRTQPDWDATQLQCRTAGCNTWPGCNTIGMQLDRDATQLGLKRLECSTNRMQHDWDATHDQDRDMMHWNRDIQSMIY